MTVGCGSGEAEFARGDGAVEREGCAGDGAGAERAEVHARAGVGEAGEIALDHADVGEEPVGDQDRLGALQVGVGGHDRFAGCRSARSMRASAQCFEAVERGVDGVAHEEAHVGGDLLVAAAAGVELQGEVADVLRQQSSEKWWMSSALGASVASAGLSVVSARTWSRPASMVAVRPR